MDIISYKYKIRKLFVFKTFYFNLMKPPDRKFMNLRYQIRKKNTGFIFSACNVEENFFKFIKNTKDIIKVSQYVK